MYGETTCGAVRRAVPAAVLAALCAAGTAAPTIENGDMETVLDGAVVNWTVERAQASPCTETPLEGLACLHVRVEPGHHAVIEPVSGIRGLLPERLYHLELGLRCPPLRLRVMLGELDGDGHERWRLLGPWETDVLPPMEWTRVSLPFTTAADTVGAKLRLRVSADRRADRPQSLWLDAVRVREAGRVVRGEEGPDRMTNGGFEEWDPDSGLPAGWRAWGPVQALDPVRDPAQAYAGTASLRLALGENQCLNIVNDSVEVPYPAICRFSVWARGEGRLQFGADRYTATRIRIGPVLAGVGGETGGIPVGRGWGQYTGELPLEHPEGARITPLIRVCGEVWLDEAQLRIVPIRLEENER